MHLPWASPFCLGELLQSPATHRLMPQSISHAGGRKVLAGPLKHRSWEEPWHRIRQISTELQLWLTSRDIARKRDRNTSIGLAFRVVIASKRYYGISQFHESSSAKLWFQLWPSWDTGVPLSHGHGAAQLCDSFMPAWATGGCRDKRINTDASHGAQVLNDNVPCFTQAKKSLNEQILEFFFFFCLTRVNYLID